jgi:hypothetical protein
LQAANAGFIGGKGYFTSTIGHPSLSHFNSVTISFEIHHVSNKHEQQGNPCRPYL